MKTLKQVQDFMRSSLEGFRKQRYVNVSGDSLEDALRQASIELSLPLKRIEYEVLDPGAKGMMGMGKKPCLILAYPSAQAVAEASEEFGGGDFDMSFDLSKNVDGKVFIRKDEGGVMMKVTKPEGDGIPVSERTAVAALVEKRVVGFDKGMVAKLVKNADGLFVKIADLNHDPTEDAIITYELRDMEMKAFVTIRPSGERGADPDRDAIMSFLQANGIVFGYHEEIIQELADNPVYNRPVLVAEGEKARNGDDGKIVYNFETDTNNIRLKEIDGKVDYRELNNINNVVSGQVLAKLSKPTQGEAGQTVTGKLLPAKAGKPIGMEIGNNVRLSDDGTTAIAETNGQVIILSGKISVEPVYVVNNGVDLKTGNILFLGTVIVNGNVEDGFSVKAAGNIEITGSVGKCELDAEGDVIIRQGMNGKESGTIHAGGNVYAKFIQNTNVESSGMVIVSDGIINSHIASDKKILCKGKRASIVGGKLRAAEEINAKSLGSIANVETILEVGFDPKSKEKLDNLLEEQKEVSDRLDELSKDINLLEQTLKANKKLPPDKQKRYEVFKAEQMELQTRIQDIEDDKADVHSYLAELKANGKVSASGAVFPGVHVTIKDANLDVRNDFKAVTFVNEKGTVKVTKYEEIDEDISIRPER